MSALLKSYCISAPSLKNLSSILSQDVLHRSFVFPIMSLPIRSNLLLAVVCLLAPANAYDIDLTSCNTDAKSTYISNAVADSQSMLQAGKEALLESQEGDTRKAVWKTDDESQLQQIQGYFSTVLDTEGLFQYSAGSSPLIYCDDSSWIKLGNAGTASQWWDSTQELIINTSKAKLCDNSAGPQAGLATTYRVSNNKLDDNDKGLSSIVIMCNAGPDVTGASPDTSGNVATLQEIVSQTTDPTDPDKYPGNGKKSFYVGKSLDYIVGYWLSSFTVAHEFTHVVQATKSQPVLPPGSLL